MRSIATPIKRVFVSSPYAGDTVRNVAFAVECCKYVVGLGMAPYAPHLICPYWTDENDQSSRDSGIQIGLQFLLVCDELWFFSNENTYYSTGMQIERHVAILFDIPMQYYIYRDGLFVNNAVVLKRQ